MPLRGRGRVPSQAGLDRVQVPASKIQQRVERRSPRTRRHHEPLDRPKDHFRLIPAPEHHEGFGAVVSGAAETEHAQRCGLVHGAECCRGGSLVSACRRHHVGVVRPRSQEEVRVLDLLGDSDGFIDGFERGDEVASLCQVRSDRRQDLPLDQPRSALPGEPEGAVGEAVAVDDVADTHVHPRLRADHLGLRSRVVGGRQGVGDAVEHGERPLCEPRAGGRQRVRGRHGCGRSRRLARIEDLERTLGQPHGAIERTNEVRDRSSVPEDVGITVRMRAETPARAWASTARVKCASAA